MGVMTGERQMPAKKRTVAKTGGTRTQAPVKRAPNPVLLAVIGGLINMTAVSATVGLVVLCLVTARRFV
jgi:hypothetical protein